MSQGVLPSQIRTRKSCLVALRSSTSGGGANGQPAARGIGKSRMSDMIHWRLPQPDDRINESLRLDRPTRPRVRAALGEFTLVFGAGVHEQVACHRDPLGANAFGKVGKA